MDDILECTESGNDSDILKKFGILSNYESYLTPLEVKKSLDLNIN